MTLDDPLTGHAVARTVEFAASARLPAIYGNPLSMAIGGLMSYHFSCSTALRATRDA